MSSLPVTGAASASEHAREVAPAAAPAAAPASVVAAAAAGAGAPQDPQCAAPHCGRPTPLRCAGCCALPLCGNACAAAAWPGHRQACLAAASALASFPSSASVYAFAYGLAPTAPVAPACAGCHSSSTASGGLCPRCRAVRYCSAPCASAHWRRGHKLACLPAAPATSQTDAVLGVELRLLRLLCAALACTRMRLCDFVCAQLQLAAGVTQAQVYSATPPLPGSDVDVCVAFAPPAGGIIAVGAALRGLPGFDALVTHPYATTPILRGRLSVAVGGRPGDAALVAAAVTATIQVHNSAQQTAALGLAAVRAAALAAVQPPIAIAAAGAGSAFAVAVDVTMQSAAHAGAAGMRLFASTDAGVSDAPTLLCALKAVVRGARFSSFACELVVLAFLAAGRGRAAAASEELGASFLSLLRAVADVDAESTIVDAENGFVSSAGEALPCAGSLRLQLGRNLRARFGFPGGGSTEVIFAAHFPEAQAACRAALAVTRADTSVVAPTVAAGARLFLLLARMCPDAGLGALKRA